MTKIKRGTLNWILALLAVIVIVPILVITVQTTLALYVDQSGTATNTVTLGKVDGDIVEEDFTGEVTEDNGVFTAAKIVNATNNGTAPVWVRARLVYDSVFVPIDNDEDIGSGWTFEDGWYYYTGLLAPEATTTSLIEEVQFVSGTTDDQIASAQFIVYMEFVQDWVDDSDSNSYATTAQDAFAQLDAEPTPIAP